MIKHRVVFEFRGIQVVEVNDASLGAKRFFGQKNGVTVTKGFPYAEAVRTEIEMLLIKQKTGANDLTPLAARAALSPASLLISLPRQALINWVMNGKSAREKRIRQHLLLLPFYILIAVVILLPLIYS